VCGFQGHELVVIVGRSASVAEKTGEQALLRRGGDDDDADRDKVELLALLVSELGLYPTLPGPSERR
jgi:hypothetical protein